MTDHPTAVLESHAGTAVDQADFGDGVVRVARGARTVLIVAGTLLAAVAFWLPITDESAHDWQIFLGIVGLAAAIAAAFARVALIVMMAAAVTTAGLSLVDTESTLIGPSLAGVVAFASCETLSVARMWASVGVVDRVAERIHLRAILVRAGVGLLAAAVCVVIGLIRLPSPGLIAALGVLAASVVIVGSALRAVGADPPP